MTEGKGVAIYGAGGFAREVAWLLSAASPSPVEVVGYIDDRPDRKPEINGMPVFSLDWLASHRPDATIVVAIGKPATRESVVSKCASRGFGFYTAVHHSVEVSPFVSVGGGSIICSGSILTVNIEIAQHVHINLDCTIGHDVRIGQYATLSPGVHVSGNVHIGEGVFIGTGAAIVNGADSDPLCIREGTVIGAGACVIGSTEPRSLYVGVPAKLKTRLDPDGG